MIEGLALAYYPHFDIVQETRPFIETLIKQRLKDEFSMKKVAKRVIDTTEKMLELPKQASRVLKKIESGSIRLHIEDTDIKRLAVEIDRSSNRIAFATIIAAFVIAGALVMNIQTFALSPTSILALVLFALAGILGLTLFYSIRKEER